VCKGGNDERTRDTRRATKSKSATKNKSEGFAVEERAAMKERARELKADARRVGGEKDLLAKIAEMPEPDRAIGN
jgi:hypothetical protein